MIIFDAERPSDSPFVERVWRSHSEGASTAFLSTAESRCELVVTKLQGNITMTVRGAETKATSAGNTPPDGEWLGIRLKVGTFLSQLPAGGLVDAKVTLPEAASNTFWLGGSAWQFPNYDNADTFIDRLVRAGLLVREPIIHDAFLGRVQDLSLRSVQRRFLQTVGVTQSTARQIERARYAAFLLQRGISILDTTMEAGYFDQPHLTRAMKYFIGQTPTQIQAGSTSKQLSFLYKTKPFC
jgi:AraC-like DNA-binding protein